MTTASAVIIALCAAVAAFNYLGSRVIRRELDLHPFFKVCKQVLVGLAIYSLVGRLIGANKYEWYGVVFWGILCGYAIIEWRAIVRRSGHLPMLRVRTQRGLAWVEDPREAALIVSMAAGIIRHQRFDGNQYVSEAAIEEVLEALGVPPKDEMMANIRRQMEERRLRKADEGIMAAEIDLFNREFGGGK